VFADRLVLSWCNGQFLERLPSIMYAGRPARIVWFNCMTWLFDREREAHERGWIDYFGFVSPFQKQILHPQLEEIAAVQSFEYVPFFNCARVDWQYREWAGTYRLGRISRDDANKFAHDTWRIFDRVLVPKGLSKKVFILGYGENAASRIGSAPLGLDWRTWLPNEIGAEEFYRTVDTLVHKTGGSRESYGRMVVESYAHGVVPIVEDDFAFPNLVVHGETGYRSNDSDEMSYFASHLAANPELHRRLAQNGRAFLEEQLVNRDRCWAGWQQVLL
jgi:hypothetical protein